MNGTTNFKIGPLKADNETIEFAKMALEEMAPLEAGYFLRDLGKNFPVTMNALKIARENLGIITRTITNKSAMIEIGTCPKPAGAGFTPEQVKKAQKLEIVECMKHSKRPYRLYCLRGELNRLLFQTRVWGQNV